MTVSTTTAKVSYTGNGSTTAFAVPFVFFGSSELEVIERTIATGAEVVKTLTTHYTVTGGDGATGTVTALTAPASTVEWHIRRKTARTQLVDYQAHDAFPADTHERALDRAAARDQEIEEKVGRALVFPKTDASTLDPELPASVDRATKLLGFDSDGNPVVTTMTLDEIEEGATDAAASAVAAAASAGAASGSASTASAAATAASGSAVAAAASAASIALPLPIGSGGTGQATENAALYALIAGATVDTAPNIANDKIPYAKASGTTGRAMSIQAFWNLLNSLTAYTTLNSADEMALRDGSGGGAGARKMTVANFLLGIGAQGRNIAGRNGGLEVWQRGAGGGPASFSVPASTTQYTADGWAIKTNANQASTVTQTARSGVGSRWSALIQRNNGQTGTTAMSFEFPLDTDEIYAIQGKTVSLALDIQAGANWSPTSGNLTVELRTGTGASPAKRSAGAYTGDAAPVAATIALTPGGAIARFSPATNAGLTGAVGSTVTQASIYITWTPVGTAGANDWFLIDDVQLEVSPIATPFERRPFVLELMACQRHYEKSYDYSIAPGAVTSTPGFHMAAAQGGGATNITATVTFCTPKRGTPSVSLWSGTGAANQFSNDAGAASSFVGLAASNQGNRSFSLINHTTATSIIGFHWAADAGI